MHRLPSLRTTAGLLGVSAMISGCHGIIWGNLAMLAIAVGIFMGTLSLGRD